MSLSDFAKFQVPSIEWLVKRGSIQETIDGILNINADRVFVLKDLFEHEVICPNYYHRTRNIIDRMVQNDDSIPNKG